MTHAQDVIRESEKVPTLNARMGTGGNQVPILMENIPKVYDVNSAKELDRANTLDTSCRGVWGKQNSTVVYSLEGNGSRESHHGPGFTNSDKMYTLNTVEHHAVAYCMGHDERSAQFKKNKTDPLTASDYKQPPVVAQPMSTTGQSAYAIGNGTGRPVTDECKSGSIELYARSDSSYARTCNGKQTVGSLCAHDRRGFNGQDVANDKLVIERYETDNDS